MTSLAIQEAESWRRNGCEGEKKIDDLFFWD